MPQNAYDLRVCVQINILHQTGFNTTNSRLSTHDDLITAGTVQWQPAISISVLHKKAQSLELDLWLDNISVHYNNIIT